MLLSMSTGSIEVPSGTFTRQTKPSSANCSNKDELFGNNDFLDAVIDKAIDLVLVDAYSIANDTGTYFDAKLGNLKCLLVNVFVYDGDPLWYL
jgi:hypothetical protein